MTDTGSRILDLDFEDSYFIDEVSVGASRLIIVLILLKVLATSPSSSSSSSSPPDLPPAIWRFWTLMDPKPVLNKVASFGKCLSAVVGELVARGYWRNWKAAATTREESGSDLEGERDDLR